MFCSLLLPLLTCEPSGFLEVGPDQVSLASFGGAVGQLLPFPLDSTQKVPPPQLKDVGLGPVLARSLSLFSAAYVLYAWAAPIKVILDARYLWLSCTVVTSHAALHAEGTPCGA